MKQDQKIRFLYAIAGIIMFIVCCIAFLWGWVFQTYNAGPYTPKQPFLYLSNLYLLTFVVALVSGILLILRRLVWVSISGVIFTLTCGVLSGPIAAYLAWIAFSGRGFWQVFGYILGSPLIVLSVISLFVVVLGFRKANKLRIIG